MNCCDCKNHRLFQFLLEVLILFYLNSRATSITAVVVESKTKFSGFEAFVIR